MPFALCALSALMTSCGFWNPDPAERLAYAIERNTSHLGKSGQAAASFDFVPDADRAKISPRFHDEVVIRVVPDRSVDADEGSVIVVSEWFWTTYHSRFVRVAKAMEATKQPGEPFRIVLEKSGDSVYWTELK